VSPASAAKITAAYPAWSPTEATINAGQSVEFESTESLAHGVGWGATAPETPSCTGVPGPAQAGPWSGSCTFTQAGSYPFHCTLHASMTGTITVNSTGPGKPIVTTSAATSITDTGATLKGSVNPNGLATKYFFKYGTSATPYSTETGKTSVSAGTSPVTASTAVSGLSPETTYHFRLFAENTSGTTEGGDLTLTTGATDTTDPQTTIKTKPADPSSSSTAEFTYESNEAGSTFECKMDGESFTACPSTGKTYTGLGEGPHTFQVRATDTSFNTDESPAGYSFSVVLPVTPPEVTPPPTGNPPPPTVNPPPVVAPSTTITLKPKAKTKDRTPTFKFKSTVSGATFKCTLDAKALKPCRSPLTTKKLSFGPHTFKVSAVAGGASDPTPAAVSSKCSSRSRFPR
jgi:plastocyanin